VAAWRESAPGSSRYLLRTTAPHLLHSGVAGSERGADGRNRFAVGGNGGVMSFGSVDGRAVGGLPHGPLPPHLHLLPPHICHPPTTPHTPLDMAAGGRSGRKFSGMARLFPCHISGMPAHRLPSYPLGERRQANILNSQTLAISAQKAMWHAGREAGGERVA